MAVNAGARIRTTVRTSPMLMLCPVPGCSSVTMGGTCIKHDPAVIPVYPRGRPIVEAGSVLVAVS